MQKLKIEYINKTDLKPYANNAKIHTSEQIGQIKKSVEEFGFNDPVAIWKDNEIIEGHGRLLAVMEMDDIEKIPVIRLDKLTDDERRAYMLVHNQLTINTGFDIDLLNEELNALPDEFAEDFGFVTGMDDLEKLAQNIGDDEEEEKEKVICPRCGKVVAEKE